MGAGLRMPKQCTNILIQPFMEYVFKFAACFMYQGPLIGKDVYEQSFRQPMPSDTTSGLFFSVLGQANLIIFDFAISQIDQLFQA